MPNKQARESGKQALPYINNLSRFIMLNGTVTSQAGKRKPVIRLVDDRNGYTNPSLMRLNPLF